MAIFTTERTARKGYRCSDCGGRILPGERYASSAITPRDPEMGDADGKRWGRIRSHVNCEETEKA